jgi:hypothetical protein
VTPYAVCAIGNSHAAAYHLAWKHRLKDALPHVSMTFFAAQSLKLRKLVHQDGAFVAHDRELADAFRLSADGKSRIEIAAYDAFVALGLGARVDVAALCGPHGTIRHRGFGRVDDLVSEACFTAMVEASFRNSIAYWFLDCMRGAKPVLICPTPFRSENELVWAFMGKARRFENTQLRREVIAQAQTIGSAFAARHGAEFVWQDEATLGAPGFTRPEFGRNALRLDKPPMEDGMHMNEEFGAVMLDRVLARIDALSGGRIYGPPETNALRTA